MPMSWRWTLPDDHSAEAEARGHVGDTLAAWPNVEDIALVASELTTNAIDYGSGVRALEISLDDERARVLVSHAADSGTPVPRHAGPDDDGGRGLALVGVLADDWGWLLQNGRLSVWADFVKGGDQTDS